MRCVLVALLAVSAASVVNAERIVITGALVIDGTGAPPEVRTVILNGERIEAAGPSVSVPEGSRVIDASGMTLMPGLFDLHTHLLASGGRAPADWGKNLKAYLLSGVTTVVDLSTYAEQFEPMRRLLAEGMPGPHVLMASRFSTPGGHGAEGGRGDFHTQLVQTPEEARAAVRRMKPYKPDVLKAFTDGWRYGTGIDMTSMEEETLKALVEESHKNGVRVLTHTVTLAKAKVAARAGVDTIIHGIGDAPLDEEALALMKEKGTNYAETLAVYEPRAGRDLSSPLLPVVLDPALRAEMDAVMKSSADTARKPVKRWDNLMTNTRRFREAGLRQSLGTDAGMTGTWHGWATLHEIELMVEGGLTPLEAITAGTGTAARALGVDGDRGTIVEGKRADLVLVDGNPLVDVRDVHRVRQVFLSGKPVDLARLAQDVGMPGMTPMKARKAEAVLDDFERPDGRSRIGTLWINNTDSGHDHSGMSYQRTRRTDGTRALTVLCESSVKPAPVCSMVLPLAKGSVEPVDASAFAGVEAEVRGEGRYELRVPSRSASGRNSWRGEFEGRAQWKKVRIPFASLRTESAGAAWSGVDLLNLEFVIARQADENAWFELDNVRFYK